MAKYLLPFEEAAAARSDKGNYWWELRSCAYYDEFELPKLIFPDISAAANFTLDTTGSYIANTGYMLPVDDKFLLGVLNSSPTMHFSKSLTTVMKDGFFRFIRQNVEQLPIPAATPDEQAHIAGLVQQILDAKAADQAADTLALEAEVDAAVAALYGVAVPAAPSVAGGGS